MRIPGARVDFLLLSQGRISGAKVGSKHKIPLRHRQPLSRFAHQQLPVRRHRIGLRIDLNVRRRVVVDKTLFRDAAARVLHRDEAFLHLQLARQAPAIAAPDTKVSDEPVRARP